MKNFTCPKTLIMPLMMFVTNGGYKCTIFKFQGEVVYTKANKPGLKIDSNGKMNEAMYDRYLMFLEMWFRHGRDFILRLKAQACGMKVAA